MIHIRLPSAHRPFQASTQNLSGCGDYWRLCMGPMSLSPRAILSCRALLRRQCSGGYFRRGSQPLTLRLPRNPQLSGCTSARHILKPWTPRHLWCPRLSPRKLLRVLGLYLCLWIRRFNLRRTPKPKSVTDGWCYAGKCHLERRFCALAGHGQMLKSLCRCRSSWRLMHVTSRR